MSMEDLPLPYILDRTRRGPVAITGFDQHALHLSGHDNYGKPAQAFADRLAQADEDEYLGIASEAIWLSAYAANNPTSDYHWQASACYYEDMRRNGSTDMYQRAYDTARSS